VEKRKISYLRGGLELLFLHRPALSLYRVGCGQISLVFSLLSSFWKNKGRLMKSRCCVCVCVCVSPLSLQGKCSVKVPLSLICNDSVNIPLSMLGNGSVKIPLSLIDNYSVKFSLSLLGNGSVETNTHRTIEELLNALFSMWPHVVSRKVGD
jgi:hypothetical protein